MAIATQFAFDAKPIAAWAERLQGRRHHACRSMSASPARRKLQTLIKFAVACGVGPSLKVLQKRAMDMSKLLLPYEPTEVLAELAAYKAENPDSLIEKVHFFPLGGIKTNANWAAENAWPKQSDQARHAAELAEQLGDIGRLELFQQPRPVGFYRAR
jgi:methylenetetrahydrofolate reductase (NADPH)